MSDISAYVTDRDQRTPGFAAKVKAATRRALRRARGRAGTKP